ncbi:hypothetical protein DAEQUDRAFT_31092 [Daedalea quercina L-15889]|uniref:Uncharacterized protein n=1 Tax=Daedalea quercina L-15889 TaxID=1314783 RepID=A0A165SQ42_9APHY|nr:hypothetical protein DAEQUDRAFT_31092 [Daedalea quercina L-15889]
MIAIEAQGSGVGTDTLMGIKRSSDSFGVDTISLCGHVTPMVSRPFSICAGCLISQTLSCFLHVECPLLPGPR